MTDSSNLQVTLGYENTSVDPDINAVLSRRSYVGDINDPNDIEASKQLELLDPDFDQNNDGFKHFLQLIDGETFTQTIDITNNGPGGTFTFDVDVTNSQFSRLTDLEIADDMGGIFLPGETVQGLDYITVDGDRQTATITAHIGHGETLKLNAVSTIDAGGFNENPDDDLDVRELDFSLIDAPGVDFGTGDAEGLVYLDPGGFNRFDGIKEGSGFEFEAFADSTLSVNFYGAEVSQETQTLRGYAEYSGLDTTANDEGSLEREDTFFFFELDGDVDTRIRVKPGGSASDELSLNDELTLLWLNRPDLQDEIDEYRFNPSDPEAYNQLLDLIDAGIADEVLSTTELNGEQAQFIRSGGLNGEGGFTQPALSGDLGDGVPTPGVPDPGDSSGILIFDLPSGDSFGDFVNENATDPNIQYRIDITNIDALNDLRFENFTADNVVTIVIPPGTDALRIINGRGSDNLDLSNTEILTSTGVDPTTGNLIPGEQTGINIWAGKGNDRITGTSGDDIIAGAIGKDSLIGGEGNDRIFGGIGKDVIQGGQGDDHIFGGLGKDVIRGGQGDDHIYGGFGKDIFVLAPGEGNDRIKDFRKWLASDLIGLADGLTFDDLSFEGSNINFGDETLAIIEGVDATTLTEADFTTEF